MSRGYQWAKNCSYSLGVEGPKSNLKRQPRTKGWVPVREDLFSYWYPAFRSWLPFQIGLWPFHPKTIGAVFGPLVPPRHISRRILRIKNALGVLAYSHGNQALLGNVPGFGESLDILPSPWQAFSAPTAEGHRDSKKIYRWKCGLQKEVSDRFALARIPDRCKRKIPIAPGVSVNRLRRIRSGDQ